jgi:hypothetical protein
MVDFKERVGWVVLPCPCCEPVFEVETPICASRPVLGDGALFLTGGGAALRRCFRDVFLGGN